MASALGKAGEDLAVSYLQSHHYRILERNVRTPFGEIDIVALTERVVVFVEVKARSSRAFGEPEEAISRKKLLHLRRSAAFLACQRFPDMNYRIDAISILGGKVIAHLQNIELS